MKLIGAINKYEFDEQKPLKIPQHNLGIFKATAQDGQCYIVKQYDNHFIKNKFTLPFVVNEVSIDFDCSSIAKSIEIINEGESIYLIRQYKEGIELKKFLKNTTFSPYELQVFTKNVAIEVLNALKVLHQKNLIHTNIKASNIILQNPNEAKNHKIKPQIAISSFSICHTTNQIPEVKTPFTPDNSAPEILLGFEDLISPKSDIYSVGMLIYNILNQNLNNFLGINQEIIDKILMNELSYSSKIPENFQQIIQKATYKYSYKSDYKTYSERENRYFTQEAINQRYNNVDEMITELENLQIKQKKFFGLF